MVYLMLRNVMEIFKNKFFTRWAKEVGMEDDSIVKAVQEMEQGLYEANLGGHIYKKRIPVGHHGKSGGMRAIVAYNIGSKAIFIYGFAKNKQDNINKKEEETLKSLAKIYFKYDKHEINHAIEAGELIEVKYE